MDYSMQLVQKHCSKYLEMFGECIQSYPHTWQTDCENERSKLAKCAETNPEISYIKSSCRVEFQTYENCMESNQVNPEKCTKLFESFTICADKALEIIQASNEKKESFS